MKLQVRTALVFGLVVAFCASAAPNADAGGLLSKLFKCKKAEEPACCPAPACPEPVCCEPEPEPVCCEPEPEPVCCEPAPAPESPPCCEPAPEPVCCEPAPEPEPVCCEPAPAPEPEPCCEPEPAPAPCCGSAMLQGYPLPELAEGEVLISISPINYSAEPEATIQPESTGIVQIALAQ